VIDKTIRTVGSSSFCDNVVSLLRGLFNNDAVGSLTDRSQNVLGLNNGILYDLRFNAYRTIDKADFITKTMSIPFTEHVSESKVEEVRMIVQSLFENEEQAFYFLNVLGLSLFTAKHEKTYILTRSGRNGKSMIMSFLSEILGDYATSETDLLTTRLRHGISCSLVNAHNTRVLLLSEPSNEDGQELKLNNNLIKSLTGNDEVTVRALYKNTVTFKPTFNVFMLCNEIPSFEKVEPAMIERLSMIRFPYTFVEKHLLQKSPSNRLIDKDLKTQNYLTMLS
jgi:putative DNA primase/helicase